MAASTASFILIQEAFRMKHELGLGGTITAEIAPTVREQRNVLST
jgi:hypothetical protein